MLSNFVYDEYQFKYKIKKISYMIKLSRSFKVYVIRMKIMQNFLPLFQNSVKNLN